MATSEHSMMASTLQCNQGINTSTINTVGDTIGTSLLYEVRRQARIEVISPLMQQQSTRPQELTEQFPTEWNSTIKAITQRDRCTNGRIPLHQVWSHRSLDQEDATGFTNSQYCNDYEGRRHHQMTFNAMPTNLRS